MKMFMVHLFMSPRAGDWIETFKRLRQIDSNVSLRVRDWIETTSSEAMS